MEGGREREKKSLYKVCVACVSEVSTRKSLFEFFGREPRFCEDSFYFWVFILI
jgi:hypothetical protein